MLIEGYEVKTSCIGGSNWKIEVKSPEISGFHSGLNFFASLQFPQYLNEQLGYEIFKANKNQFILDI